MIRKIILTTVLFLLAYNIFGQNLINNSSFELYSNCPYESAQIDYCNYWQCPNNSSPDYLVQCYSNFISDHSVSVPENCFGYQKAYQGKAYIGIITLYKDRYKVKGRKYKNDYVEYVQTKFKKPLLKDKRYLLKLQVSCAESSNFYNDYIDFCFSKDSVLEKYDESNLLICDNCVEFKSPDSFRNKKEWQEISILYTAKGGENFLTIGTFYYDGIFKEINKKIKSNLFFKETVKEESAYYYIDNVSLIPVDSLGNEIILYPELIKKIEIIKKLDSLSFENISIGESLVLNNIYFDLNKSKLLPSSFPELDKLKQILLDIEKLKIEICGHTDNSGTDEYNMNLSLNRAKAVYVYLIENGVNSSQLLYKGLGSAKPIVPNDSEENMALNRRVEIVVIDK